MPSASSALVRKKTKQIQKDSGNVSGSIQGDGGGGGRWQKIPLPQGWHQDWQLAPDRSCLKGARTKGQVDTPPGHPPLPQALIGKADD